MKGPKVGAKMAGLESRTVTISANSTKISAARMTTATEFSLKKTLKFSG